jgi:uncharacterized tellurite resistance protein B-like protein
MRRGDVARRAWDGKLAAHERHVVWRIADLPYVLQGALRLARARALGTAG